MNDKKVSSEYRKGIMLKFINLVMEGREESEGRVKLFFIFFLSFQFGIIYRVIGNENERGEMTEVKGGK